MEEERNKRSTLTQSSEMKDIVIQGISFTNQQSNIVENQSNSGDDWSGIEESMEEESDTGTSRPLIKLTY